MKFLILFPLFSLALVESIEVKTSEDKGKLQLGDLKLADKSNLEKSLHSGLTPIRKYVKGQLSTLADRKSRWYDGLDYNNRRLEHHEYGGVDPGLRDFGDRTRGYGGYGDIYDRRNLDEVYRRGGFGGIGNNYGSRDLGYSPYDNGFYGGHRIADIADSILRRKLRGPSRDIGRYRPRSYYLNGPGFNFPLDGKNPVLTRSGSPYAFKPNNIKKYHKYRQFKIDFYDKYGEYPSAADYYTINGYYPTADFYYTDPLFVDFNTKYGQMDRLDFLDRFGDITVEEFYRRNGFSAPFFYQDMW